MIQPLSSHDHPPPPEGVFRPPGRHLIIFILLHPPPGRSFRTVGGPIGHIHLPARRQRNVPVIVTRLYVRTAAGPIGQLRWPICHQGDASSHRLIQPVVSTRLSVAMKTYPVVQLLVFRTARNPAVHLGLSIRHQDGVSGPRVVQPFIFTHYTSPGSRTRTASGPGVHLRSLSAASKAYSPLFSTPSGAPKGKHPGRGSAHRLLRPPEADLTPTRSRAATPRPPHCPRPGMGVAADHCKPAPRDALRRPAHATSPIPNRCPLLAPLPFSSVVSF